MPGPSVSQLPNPAPMPGKQGMGVLAVTVTAVPHMELAGRGTGAEEPCSEEPRQGSSCGRTATALVVIGARSVK